MLLLKYNHLEEIEVDRALKFNIDMAFIVVKRFLVQKLAQSLPGCFQKIKVIRHVLRIPIFLLFET